MQISQSIVNNKDLPSHLSWLSFLKNIIENVLSNICSEQNNFILANKHFRKLF